VPVVFEWDGIESCQQFIRDVIPFSRRVIDRLPADRQAELWRAHAAAIRKYQTPDGKVRATNMAVCAVGSRPPTPGVA
jgi:hypothetical protein